jgi:hypothetical protein
MAMCKGLSKVEGSARSAG